LSSVVEKTEEIDDSFKTFIIDHLPSLEIEFQQYFSELRGRRCICTKSVLYLSGYSQYFWRITGPI